MNVLRVVVATVVGAAFGGISWFLATRVAPEPITWYGLLTIISGRTLMGFAIGVSSWGLVWWLHGTVMGAIFSAHGAFGMVWGKFGWDTFASVFIGGIIMGFLIELIVRLALRASTQEPSMTRRS